MNLDFRENEVYTLDLHGYDIIKAKMYIESLLLTLPTEIREVVIIHGYHNGKALLNFVRNELNSPCIERKILFLNNGRTSLIIKN